MEVFCGALNGSYHSTIKGNLNLIKKRDMEALKQGLILLKFSFFINVLHLSDFFVFCSLWLSVSFGSIKFSNSMSCLIFRLKYFEILLCLFIAYLSFLEERSLDVEISFKRFNKKTNEENDALYNLRDDP